MSLRTLIQGALPVTAPLVHDMLATIELEKLLAVERRTVEHGGRATGGPPNPH